jgi:hypothetical protein
MLALDDLERETRRREHVWGGDAILERYGEIAQHFRDGL